MKTMTLATMTAGLILGTTANAAITYVDAVEGAAGNTFATGVSPDDTTWAIPSQTSPNATKWSKRDSGNGGTIFQALPNGDPSGIPELTTKITGLADGIYDVWVFFQDNVGDDAAPVQNWVISAGLESGDLTTYWGPGQAELHQTNPPAAEPGQGVVTQDGVFNAADLTFTSSVVIGEGSGTGERNLFGVNLGTATVSGGSDINVYVDMLINGNSGTTRVWYDGVGFEVVPEPSSLALLGLGGLLLARRRRG